MLLMCHSCFLVVTCSIPDAFPSHVSPINNECVPGSTVEYNSTCSFACDTGYNISDSTSISCTESGALSTGLPNCTGNYKFVTIYIRRDQKAFFCYMICFLQCSFVHEWSSDVMQNITFLTSCSYSRLLLSQMTVFTQY